MAPFRAGGRPATRRRGSARRRRSSRRPRSSTIGVLLLVAVLVGVPVVDWLGERPGLVAGIAVAAVLLAVGAGACYLAWWRVRRQHRLARTRSIAVADGLTGTQFEHWLADLMRRSGFTQVVVSGGAGDLGADVVARAPDQRLVVVQCKRYAADRRVGSPEVQRFAGTARQLHGADIAVIVTTATFTRPAEATAARLGIRLVDREMLTRWAAEGLIPVALATRAPSRRATGIT